MPQMGFEPTIPVFELTKTVHALDRAATVIGRQQFWIWATKTEVLNVANGSRILDVHSSARHFAD
jgi:hypothetical protein